METPQDPRPRDPDADSTIAEEMARADVANGERPAPSDPQERTGSDRERTAERPTGEDRGDVDRAEESPS
jgi:hypothetical protein